MILAHPPPAILSRSRDRRRPAASPIRTKRIRVLLVDDHGVVRSGVAALVAREADMDVCGEAATFEEALGAFRSLRPDVVVTDISLAAADGLDLIRALRAEADATPVLVLSMHDESIYAERVLRAGGNGFVRKTEAPKTLIAAIRKVAAGGIHLSEASSGFILSGLMGGARSHVDPVRSLSDRELQVFECIGQGLTIDDIARRLFVSPKTVATHRERIRRKLRLERSADLLCFAVKHYVAEQGRPTFGTSETEADAAPRVAPAAPKRRRDRR